MVVRGIAAVRGTSSSGRRSSHGTCPAGKAVGQAHRSEQDPVGVSVGHLYQSHLY